MSAIKSTDNKIAKHSVLDRWILEYARRAGLEITAYMRNGNQTR